MLIVNSVVQTSQRFLSVPQCIDSGISSLSIIGDFQKQKEGDVCCISMVIGELFRYSVLQWNIFLMYHDDIAVEYYKFTYKFI